MGWERKERECVRVRVRVCVRECLKVRERKYKVKVESKRESLIVRVSKLVRDREVREGEREIYIYIYI